MTTLSSFDLVLENVTLLRMRYADIIRIIALHYMKREKYESDADHFQWSDNPDCDLIASSYSQKDDGSRN